MTSDVKLIKVEARGPDIESQIHAACRTQALPPDPRKLVSTFVLRTDPNFDTVFLVFELDS